MSVAAQRRSVRRELLGAFPPGARLLELGGGTGEDALFLAAGTGRARDLDLPGHELDGVLRAIEYLLNVNQGFKVELGERVLVVGGGNVAFDAARTALRAAGVDDTAVAVPVAAQSNDDARRAMTTTLDVARSARRAGVLDVTVLALESP